jgi:hypothetical protein
METPKGWRQIRAEELVRHARSMGVVGPRRTYTFVLGAASMQPAPTHREIQEAIVAVSAEGSVSGT